MSEVITSLLSFDNLNSLNNKIIYNSSSVKMKNSKIIFNGRNNTLYLCDDVVLDNAYISFSGNDSTIFIGHYNKICFTIFAYNNSNIFIGKRCYFNTFDHNKIYFFCSEGCSIIIGDFCIFSFGITLRTSDVHPIYDSYSLNFLNKSKSIFCGDHVWVGQNCLLLKGTHIHSGAIIGANSVISSKTIPSNTIWCGNPVKMVKTFCFFSIYSMLNNINSLCYENLTNNKILSCIFHEDSYTIKFDKIKSSLQLYSYDHHNRFAYDLENYYYNNGMYYYLIKLYIKKFTFKFRDLIFRIFRNHR